jgi:2-dehydropantoate 2-reductase
MGGLFGGLLTLAGEEIWLLDTRADQVNAIRQHGLTIRSATGDLVTSPNATTDPRDIGTADVVIIFVKSTATTQAAQTAQSLLGADTAVLTLQNGYGNAEKLAALLGPERVIAGTTAQGATLVGPGQVLHGGAGDTHIGSLTGGVSPALDNIAATLTRAGIPTIVDTDVTALIWGKLIINVGINALTGITGLKNGQLADYAETTAILKMAVLEAVKVADALGVTLPYPQPVAKVLAVAAATAQNRSSLLQDLSNNRLTEIDAINGAIVEAGIRLGIPTPVNQTLTLLVKTFEKIDEQNRP